MPAALVYHLVPHTHWDREWYRTEAGFRPALVACLDDLIGRLDQSPEIKSFHLDGQSILIEDYLQVRPERLTHVADLVRGGRLIIGPWYVLADNQLPSDHAMQWNLRLGMADLASLGGACKVAYLPDAFGHAASTPDLLAGVGLPYAVLWRGLGTTKDLFRWTGPGGGEVLVYHLPPQGYEVGASLRASTVPTEWPTLRRTLVRRATTRHVLVPIGADHHRIHPDLVGLRDALQQEEPDSEFRFSSLDAYFEAVEREIGREDLPGRTGDLRDPEAHTWTLQGTLSTRAPLKRRVAQLELWLARVVEPLVVRAARLSGAESDPLLNEAWRTLVSTHFHDTLGGCCADGVAASASQRLARVEELGGALLEFAIEQLLDHDPDLGREQPSKVQPRLILWNPSAEERSGEVVEVAISVPRRRVTVGSVGTAEAPEEERTDPPTGLVDHRGRVIPIQPLKVEPAVERSDAHRHYPRAWEVDRHWVAFRLPPIGPHSLATLALQNGSDRPSPSGRVSVDDRAIANQFIRVAVQDDGTFTLQDLETGEVFPGLGDWTAEADVGDTYTFCPPRCGGPLAVERRCLGTATLAHGPLLGGLALRSTLRIAGHGTVGVTTCLTVADGSRAVRLRVHLWNRALGYRLRFRIRTGITGQVPVRIGRPRGAIVQQVRKTESNPLETVVSTFPVHRWLVARSRGRGLGIFAPGCFEAEWTGEGEALVTVLRSVGQLSRGNLWTRPGHAGWPTPTPGAQCVGPDSFTLAIASVGGNEDDHALERLWERIVVPPAAWWKSDYTGRDLPIFP